MTDRGVIQALVVGHLWQSVALAAVLAGALILGRRMRGATRYNLAVMALVASIALPLAAFIPGESLARTVLDKLGAPATIAQRQNEQTPSALALSPLERMTGRDGSTPEGVKLASKLMSAATNNGAIPMSETSFGKIAVENGAPAWALDLGGNFLTRKTEPKPEPKPVFTVPEIKLPELNLPDLTLPLLMVWIAGAIMLLTRTGRDLVAVERLVARAEPANLPDKLKTRMTGVRVAISPDAPGPMAAGLFRPCIVLPENIALTSPGMAALLEHERAHIERRDMVVALLQRVLLALLWWSPALHWISRRIDEEREVACDEAAVDRTGNAKSLARSLTIEAENQLWVRAPRLAVGAIGPRSQVGRRIKRLIEVAKGSPYAKYSGRLAFAGLALAVAVAAMVTPRFNADAQQPDALPPVDSSLDGGPQDRTLTPDARYRADLRSLRNADDKDIAALGEDFAALMDDLNRELQVSLSSLSPELEGELQGLSAELAGLGVEISSMVSQEVLSELPSIMEEVRQELEVAGVDPDDLDQWREHKDEIREAIEDAREDLREALGPEMREEIRAAIEEARAEVAAHRDEIRSAALQSQAGAEIARRAMAQARAELAAARARGDFDKFKDWDWKSDFKPDQQTMEKLREAARKAREAAEKARLDRVKLDGASSSERLFYAASRCREDEARRLISEEKADVNAVLRGDGTPLIAAARRGCEDVVRMLLNAGGDPDLASPGDGNPLTQAAEHGEDAIVRMLLDAGADIDRGAPRDGNPLIKAAQHGERQVVQLLLDRGADVNAYVPGDETALISAAQQGEEEVVRLLVDHGAKVNLAYNVKTYNGGTELRSPLNQAEKYGHRDVAEFLRSKGAVAEPKPAN